MGRFFSVIMGLAVALVALILLPSLVALPVRVAVGDAALPPVSKDEPKTFVEAIGKINATPAFFDALTKQPDEGPTINLNLLRYRPRGDSGPLRKFHPSASRA